MAIKSLLNVVLLLIAGSAIAVSSGDGNFIINIADTVQSEQRRKASQGVFLAIYAEIGIVPQFRSLPSLRGLDMVNKGVYDAEAGRLEGVASAYANLVKIPTPIGVFKTGIFCLKQEHCSLQKQSKAANLDGFRSATLFCQQKQIDCTKVRSVAMLAKLIREGFADAFLATTMDAPQILCLLDVDTAYYHHIPEFDVAAFHYIHKQHIQLAPDLNKAISKVAKTGLIEKSLFSWREELMGCDTSIIEI